MCGIVGVGGRHADRQAAEVSALIEGAADALAHRGPDGSGTWASTRLPVALGHRRLAVIDLSQNASQPMVVGDASRAAITFNGEIYNHQAIRRSLEARGVTFRTSSDTEVLLQACRRLGVEAALAQLRGMFAFGYVDESTRTLWLARDRFGEKPLYYAVWDGTLAFASELKALRRLPGFPTELDHVGVELLMRHSCIGGDRTIYRSARKVLPGTVVRVRIDDHMTWESTERIIYWDPIEVAHAAAAAPFGGDLDEAADELDELMGRSVVAATVSDVPVGAFLSGGVDASSVVSQLSRRCDGVVRTFTIGFGDEYRSESEGARRIASHLGTHHTDLTVTAKDALDVIPVLPEIYDEPFADSSQIPTFLVAQLARKDVTVALSGDGGDELFGGYPRYRRVSAAWESLQRIPDPARRCAAAVLERPSDRAWQRIGAVGGRGRIRPVSGSLGERALKGAAALRATRVDDIYRLFNTSFWERSALQHAAEVPERRLPAAPTPMEQMMLADTVAYLPDDILTKVDRAAMAVSLETRVPLLDPEMFAFAHRLPLEIKVSGSEQKRVIRHLLARHLPRELWDHPKRGFSVPVGGWIRGPLRPWAEDLLSSDSLRTHDLFDRSAIDTLWSEHQDGRRDWSSRLWNVLMFQAWIRSYTPTLTSQN